MAAFDDKNEWSGTALELGMIGAIGAGVGATVLRGSASGASRGAANTAKRIAGNVDRYLERNMFKKNPVGRTVYKAFKGVPKNSALIKRDADDALAALEYNHKAIQKNVDEERNRLVLQEIADAHMNKRTPRPVEDLFDEQAHTLKLKSEAGDKWRSGERSDYLMNGQAQQGRPQQGRPKPKQQDEKRSLASEAVGASVTGLAFGGGLTAFHALDKKLLGEDEKKQKSFDAAGSYLGGDRMNKKASTGASDMYRKLATVGDKVPLAVANGIGFTGVTIGTAKLLEQVRAEARKEVGAENPQPAVVIVENNGRKKNKTMNQAHLLSASHPGNYMLSQNAGHVDDSLEKTALANIPQKLKQFANDFAGHGSERRRLLDRIEGKSMSYENEAARLSTPGDISDIAQHYRKFNPDKANEMALADIARDMKIKDQQQHDALYHQMASARLTGLGTAAGTAGLASLAIPNKEDRR